MMDGFFSLSFGGEKLTQRDRLRRMSNKELSEFLARYLDCGNCPLCEERGVSTDGTCEASVFEWLNSEWAGEKKPGGDAEWISLGHRMGFCKHPYSEDFKCSQCGYEAYTIPPLVGPPDVCPGCGARMTMG